MLEKKRQLPKLRKWFLSIYGYGLFSCSLGLADEHENFYKKKEQRSELGDIFVPLDDEFLLNLAQ